jgi:tRNA modification GTPase
MLSQRDDPIIALATPPGRGAVGVVRLSGKSLATFATDITKAVLQPRTAKLVSIKDRQGQTIDRVLAIYFSAPHSYTGEDVLELQAHGGPVVLQMLLKHCLSQALTPTSSGAPLLPYLRMARPGEFTERAYLNHKLDLSQAEAVADLIDANTEAAVRSAGRSLEGEFSQKVDALSERLIHVRMQIEACLDFPEEDIDFIQQFQVEAQLQALQDNVVQLLTQAEQGRLLRDGLKLVIAGQPNAGKSALLNALAGAPVAIVTAIAGTTRDVLTQSIHIDGVPIHILDTAGLRESSLADEVEQIGMVRAWQQIEQADMVVLLNDLSRQTDDRYTQAQRKLKEEIQAAKSSHTVLLEVHNKIDAADDRNNLDKTAICISALSGQGLPDLRQKILALAGWQAGMAEGVFTARTRHVQALQSVRAHLQHALYSLEQTAPPLDLMAEECRLAHQYLSQLTGTFSADDLLGEIFSRFCIGK